MVSRNTVDLKEAIYNILSSDATLEALLGGAGKVKHGNPENLSEYPCVTYQVLTETDNPYFADQPTGIARSRVVIQCFSNSASSKQVTNIEDRVYELLNGQNLTTADILAYTCYRQNKSERFEANVNVWTTTSNYDLVNVGL